MSNIADLVSISIVQIIITIIVAYITLKVSRNFLDRLIERAIKKEPDGTRSEEVKRENTLKSALGNVLVVALWIATIIVILAELHVNVTALATGAGAASIIIGLGAQSVIKDWLAGIFIIAGNEYRVGDIAQLNVNGKDYSGTVDKISIRLTKMRMLDGSYCIINNGSVSVVNNHSYKFGNVVVDIIVNYDTDLDQIEKIINEVGLEVAADDELKQYIKTPVQFYRVDSFNENSITVKTFGSVHASGMQWTVAGAFRQKLHQALKKHDMSVPHQNIVIEDEETEKPKSAKK